MHAPLTLEKRVLLRAAELLRERGHCKGTLWDGEGHLCAVGALILARVELKTGTNPRMDIYCKVVENAMKLVVEKRPDIDTGGSVNNSVVEWNNEFERTGEEVAAAFEQAALT